MEHLQHFGLAQDPFSNEPDLRFYFDSACHMDALRRVERGIRQSKGLTVLTGDQGAGKSLVARRLLEALEEEILEVSMMVILPGAADAQTVMARYARQIGVEEPAADRSALLAQLYERLAIVREDGRHAVLIIDDAHTLSESAMAEIGGLLNMEYEERRLLSLVLVGAPELDERLAGETGLAQRVDVRVRLLPLDYENATQYVAHRLALSGGQPEIVPQVAIEALFKFSRGRPRLINTLSDNALFEAYLGGRRQVDASDVERAAGDLGIGPDPGTTYTQFSSVAPPASGTTVSPLPSAAAPPPPPVLEMEEPMLGEFVTEDEDELEMDAFAAVDTPDAGTSGSIETELGELLDTAGDEFDRAFSGDASITSDTVDLDAGVEAVLAEESGGGGEATRIVMAESVEESASDVQDLDDLFVELIEE